MFGFLFFGVLLAIMFCHYYYDFLLVKDAKKKAEKEGKTIYQDSYFCWRYGYKKCIRIPRNGRDLLVLISDTNRVVYDFTMDKEIEERERKYAAFLENMKNREEAIKKKRLYYRDAEEFEDCYREVETFRPYCMDQLQIIDPIYKTYYKIIPDQFPYGGKLRTRKVATERIRCKNTYREKDAFTKKWGGALSWLSRPSVFLEDCTITKEITK